MNDPRQPSSQHGVPQPQGQGGQPGQRPAAGQPARPGGIPPLPPAQGQQRSGLPPVPSGHSVPPPPPPHRPAASNDGMIMLEEDEPIALEEAASAPLTPAAPRLPAAGGTGTGIGSSGSTVTGIGGPSKIKFAVGGDKHTYTKFKRQTHVTGTGACRVRTFHGRLSDEGLAFMDDKINEWLDNHPDVEVKFVNCFAGPLEGKVTGEQGLIVTLWY